MKLLLLGDTHGLLRPEVFPYLTGPDAVLHMGDVGTAEVLSQLEARIQAPLHIVRGNVDRGDLGSKLPSKLTLEFAGHRVHLLHDLADLDLDPAAAGIELVVFGHSHQPTYFERDGVRYLNPGSIGPRRFKLPISLAEVEWSDGGFIHRFIEF